jgi:hypothetical protein
MAAPIVVGILREPHPDHIVRSNGTEIFLLEGVSASHCYRESLTAHCVVEDGKTPANAIQLKPGWLLDALASVTFSG